MVVNNYNTTKVILIQPSGKDWQPGASRGHSTSDGYELALLNQCLNEAGIKSDYILQRPLGTNKEFYNGTKRIIPNPPSLDDLADEIIQKGAEIIGLEVMSCYENNARELAKKIKQKNPSIKIIAGGYHATGYPEILYDKNIDYVILGAGEKTLPNLAQNILDKKNISDTRKLNDLPKIGDNSRRNKISENAFAFIKNGEIKLAKRLECELYQNFDEVPIPKRKIEYQEGCVSGVLADIPPNEQVMATMQTRRGCDNNCKYCASSSIYGVKGRSLFCNSNVKSINNVIAELEYLSKLGINFIFFTDPTFNEDGAYLEDLINKIIEEKENRRLSQMSFYAMFRPFNREQMEKRELSFNQYQKLKRAGFTRIAFGVENPNDKILKSMGRKNKISDLEEHLVAVHNTGIFTRGFMMYGHEDETMESLSKYKEIMKNLHVDEWRLAPMAPFVGTSTGEAYLATHKEIDFSMHDAIYSVIIPKEILEHFENEQDTRTYLMNWQKSTLKEIYQSREWKSRINELNEKFPELRKGIKFYLDYLKENLS
ncbi:MAG: B12-binding domain-containing radical SAM protein [Nanoarchaeota archaeon]